MRILTLLLIVLVLVSCNNTASEPVLKASVITAETPSPVETKVLKAKSPLTVNYESAKPLNLENEFPYDVTVMDAHGKKFNTSEILGNGKPTAVLFWLTTCPPCKRKFAALEKKYPKWKEETDFNLVAISVDWPKNAQAFSTMAKAKNWPWPVYHDMEMNFKKIMPGNLNGLPQEFLFDKNGELVYHKKKYATGYEDLLYNQIKKYAAL